MKYNKKHGLYNHRLYRIWMKMRGRCNNPSYHEFSRYGGRGIKVCDEWENDFMSFYNWSLENGYTDKLTIDRIDNDGDYEPSNCRWTTQKKQCNNFSRNHLLTYNGETHTMQEWGEMLGINVSTLSTRAWRGYPVEKILYRGNLNEFA